MEQAIYFPILRARQGEIKATGHLSPKAKTRIRPIFDILKPKPDTKNSIESYLLDQSYEHQKNWGVTTPICFDFSRYAPDEKTTSEQHPAEYFFACLRQLKIQGIPVTGTEFMRGPGYEYLDAVAQIAERDKRGVVLRMSYAEINNTDKLLATIEDTLRTLSLKSEAVDLLLDFEALPMLPQVDQSLESIMSAAIAALSAIESKSFRNIVICGGSIPEEVGPKYDWKPWAIPRTELHAWKKLMQRKLVSTVKFGDYAVTYAHMSDSSSSGQPPPRIRLSTKADHILARAPRGQYRKLSSEIIKHEAFDPALSAWGVDRIFACGTGSGGVGNASDWVARDTNLHLEITAQNVEETLKQYGRLTKTRFAQPEKTPWLQSRLSSG